MRRKFIVPGPPVGYIATTARSTWSKEFRKYADYAKLVRTCARRAGVKLPLFASEEKPLMVNTIAYFKNRVHCDPGNVQKGVCDALFYDEFGARSTPGKKRKSRKGDDKYTGGMFPPPRYDKNNPRVVIVIKSYKRKKKENGTR